MTLALSFPFLLIWSLVAFGGCTVVEAERSHLRRRRLQEQRQQSKIPEKSKRPVMHTFFVQLETMSAGMTDSGHQTLVEEWKEAWSAVGFEPKVLTIEDAKLHPDYEKYNLLLKTKYPDVNEYDRMCFLRWFAMSAAGGGWMSDYDAFPLEIDGTDYRAGSLPNSGTFTGHELHVPSLVSGSAEEWERMAHALMVAVGQPDFDNFVSDMHALLYLAEKAPATYIQSNNVHEGLFYEKSGVVDCSLIAKGKLAIHFSHNTITMATEGGTLANITDVSTAVKMRWKIAKDFMTDWHVQCHTGTQKEHTAFK